MSLLSRVLLKLGYVSLKEHDLVLGSDGQARSVLRDDLPTYSFMVPSWQATPAPAPRPLATAPTVPQSALSPAAVAVAPAPAPRPAASSAPDLLEARRMHVPPPLQMPNASHALPAVSEQVERSSAPRLPIPTRPARRHAVGTESELQHESQLRLQAAHGHQYRPDPDFIPEGLVYDDLETQMVDAPPFRANPHFEVKRK